MKIKKPIRIGDFFSEHSYIDSLAKEYGNENVDGYQIGILINAWEHIIGEVPARFTSRYKFVNGMFYVKVSSSVLRHELFLKRSTLIEKMNQHINQKIVFAIHFS